MADVKKIDLVDIDLNSGVLHHSFLSRSIGTMDVKGNGFGVRVFRGSEPANLNGVSIQGYFRDPRGNKFAITSGNVIGEGENSNEAYVVLPAACYNYEGPFALAIKLIWSSGGVTATVRIVEGMVDNTNAEGSITPAPSQTSYAEVLAAFESIEPLVGLGVATEPQTMEYLGIT